MKVQAPVVAAFLGARAAETVPREWVVNLA
jgi:hypothetical protein